MSKLLWKIKNIFISGEDNPSATLEDSSEFLGSLKGTNSSFFPLLTNDSSEFQLPLVRNWYDTSNSDWQVYLQCYTQSLAKKSCQSMSTLGKSWTYFCSWLHPQGLERGFEDT